MPTPVSETAISAKPRRRREPRRQSCRPSRELERVGDEVVEDLLQQIGIEIDLRAAGCGRLKPTGKGQRRASTLRELGERHQQSACSACARSPRLACRRVFPASAFDRSSNCEINCRRYLRVPLDHPERFDQRRGLDLVEHLADGTQDERQRRAELVRDVREEARLHPIQLAQLLELHVLDLTLELDLRTPPLDIRDQHEQRRTPARCSRCRPSRSDTTAAAR